VTLSSSRTDAVVDTVVLRYFLFVGREDLLLELLGSPLGVPRTVFDPDENTGLPEDVMSEIRRSIIVQRRRSLDRTRSPEFRSEAGRNADRLGAIADLHSAGSVEILDMTSEERALFSRLTINSQAASAGLRVALGMGEAACVAIAVHRDRLLVTDDDDALKALRNVSPKSTHTRIRALLCLAAERGMIDRNEANIIHREMRRLGFWDTADPFPAG
jgi:predicted nucleic acid-binding protein